MIQAFLSARPEGSPLPSPIGFQERGVRLRVTRHGQVIDCTPAAEEALAQTEAPLALTAGRIAAKTAEDAQRLEALLASDQPNRNGPAMAVVGDGKATWILSAALVDDLVQLTIRPTGPSLEPHLPEFDSLFGLTPTENAVLMKVLDGASVQEIAAETDKAVPTVRTHIKNIYAKFGVNSKEQLFSRVLRITFAL